MILKPLIDLLKKVEWTCNQQVEETFQSLKKALSTTLVLALLNFNSEFCMDTDACNQRVGVVLQQKGHPIAFFNKALGTQHQALSIYEKEMMAVLLTVKKWHSYLIGSKFKV